MKSISSIRSQLAYAASASERSSSEILWEALTLRFGMGRVGWDEYFDFSLYRSDLSIEQRHSFCGWRAQAALEDLLVDDFSKFLSLDKVTMYQLLSSYDLPIPTLRALYGSRPRTGKFPCLANAAELAAFLRKPGSLPVYVKPSYGGFGRGNVLLAGLSDAHTLIVGNGERVPLLQFCDSLNDRAGLGWIFQQPLTAHPAIAQRCGDKVSGVRIHTLSTATEQPDIIRVIWKINVGKEDADNFQHGNSGNMLASVDPETGQVQRVVAGIGRAQRLNGRHPVTGAELLGFTLPHWVETKQLVKQAHLAFPGFICPGWDIALCEAGPVLLEVNTFGDLDLSQHSHRQGFLDIELMQKLDALHIKHLLYPSWWRRYKTVDNGRVGDRKSHWAW